MEIRAVGAKGDRQRTDSRRHSIDTEEERLIRDLYPSLLIFARVVAPAEVDPEDLLQDALYRALRKGPVGRLDHPNAYLHRTMINLASNHRRRFGRYRTAVRGVKASTASLDAYPSDVAELLALSPRARIVVYLHFIEGASYKEIASILGCRESSVRSIATRARKRLRELEAEEEWHEAP
jgi:RNA polymerase sigma factor (sigma-70 family)